MIKMSSEQVSSLIVEQKRLASRIERAEDFTKKARLGEFRVIDIETIHLMEEQLHYMYGYNRLLKIRLYQQGVNI